MATSEYRRARYQYTVKWLTRLRTLVAALSVLGIMSALSAPGGAVAGSQFQSAASAAQDAGSNQSPAANGRPWTPVTDLDDPNSLFNDPVGYMAYVYRASLGLQNEYSRNVAMAFVDITGLQNLDTRGFKVLDATTLKTSNPALYNELGLANRPGTQEIAVIPAVNDPGSNGKQQALTEQLHSEQVIIARKMELLSPSDGGAQITPDREFTVYTDLSPCQGRKDRTVDCADLMPANTNVLYAVVDKSPGYTANFSKLLVAAQQLAKAKGESFQDDVKDQQALTLEFKNANNAGRSAKVAGYKTSMEKALAKFSPFQTAAAMPPSAANASVTASNNGLGQALSEPNVAAPGGIDFSHLQLDYLSDPGDGSGLQYAFQAPQSASGGGSSPTAALDTAGLASNAFFVWLEMDPSADWVNLNPTEPDRIVDAQVGRTDVGRIMLQADLALKKDVGQIIYPTTALGKNYWSQIEGNCMSSRVWVVPSPAQVYSTGDKLYIVKAPLNVEMEADYIQMPKGQTAAASCPQQDAATTAHNEALFRSVVLPKLVDMVNNDPSFADLRTIYRSRVAAEWYRNLSQTENTTYSSLIDQGNIGRWTTTTGWTPQQTFQQYVTSYTKGDYHLTQTETKGGYTYTEQYTYGGVDLTSVPLQQVNSQTFAAADPGLAQSVSESLTTPTVDGSGMVMLGSPTPLQAAHAAAQAAHAPKASGPVSGSSSLGSDVEWKLLLLASPLLLLALAVPKYNRRMRRSRTSAPVTAVTATPTVVPTAVPTALPPVVPPIAATWQSGPAAPPASGGATWATPPTRSPEQGGSTWSG